MTLRTLTEVAAAIAIGVKRPIAVSRARWSALASPRERQYGGRTFADASRFLQRGWIGPGVTPRLRCGAAAAGIAASATLLTSLPRVRIVLDDSPSGRAIREHLDERRLGIPKYRIAQGVLAVPETIEEYLRGRHRQAVRTNVRRARERGVRCELLTGLSERGAVADLFDPDHTDTWKREQLLALPEAVCWIAVGPDDRPIGLAVLSVDADVAMLWSLVCRDSAGRWLLHTHVVEMLAREGVGHLLVATRMAPLLQPGVQYFQRLLGYEIVHLSLQTS